MSQRRRRDGRRSDGQSRASNAPEEKSLQVSTTFGKIKCAAAADLLHESLNLILRHCIQFGQFDGNIDLLVATTKFENSLVHLRYMSITVITSYRIPLQMPLLPISSCSELPHVLIAIRIERSPV